MKLFKKIALFGITACLAVGITALTACNDKNTGELTDEQWVARLSINVDGIKSGTLKISTHNTYSKEQAAEYGEWKSWTFNNTFDLENEVLYIVVIDETYDTVTGTFATSTSYEYWFLYKNAYYKWVQDSKAEPEITQITKSIFISEVEARSNSIATISAYAQLKSMFTYNKDTDSYDLYQYGTQSASIKFLDDGGVFVTNRGSSILVTETEITNIDKTVVTVPASVKADVDAFIASQQ